ncbi:pyridoxal phosphate-dependent transferase [Rhypophila decipiens]|uniref:Pyridoxal phosphate-dependent transferase n=1 Tax=Rhypophila decipiens TaxID=261697 RepID=A0AAN6XUH7_9PEZI|nr:pyridoxal phosphate-dependent transferase [Rhypophila decipiens]
MDPSAALLAAQERFTTRNPRSKEQHLAATKSLPGGNTRTLLHTSPFPLTIASGDGAHLTDLDNHTYLDLTGELSAGLYGHNHPLIRQTLLSTFDNVGLTLGGNTIQEAKYASLLCERFKLDRVRMTNSGTEANLHALAGARRFTGKKFVVVFEGGYHGAVLSFPTQRPKQPNTVDKEDFVVFNNYNNAKEAKRQILQLKGQIAAVLVEAMQGAGGCIPATREFLHAVQEAAREAGALFILDEVMTSRLAPHGLGHEMGLKPDMLTMGKYLGGGLAFGAFGGREDVMAVYDPRVEGSLAHSGTFNNNSLVMHLGYAALKDIFTPKVSVEFNARADLWRERLQHVAKGTRLTFTGRGSLMGLHFTEDGINAADVLSVTDLQGRQRADLRDLFWFEMLEEGYWITRRGFVALILQTTDEELEGFVDAVKRFLDRHEGIMKM